MPTFVDLNSSFNQTNVNNTSTVVDVISIIKGLERFFTTGRGEVPFNRNYGTSLKALLFENDVSSEDARMFLYMDITDFEPRISISPADIEIAQVDANTVELACTFRIPSLNNQVATARATITNE